MRRRRFPDHDRGVRVLRIVYHRGQRQRGARFRAILPKARVTSERHDGDDPGGARRRDRERGAQIDAERGFGGEPKAPDRYRGETRQSRECKPRGEARGRGGRRARPSRGRRRRRATHRRRATSNGRGPVALDVPRTERGFFYKFVPEKKTSLLSPRPASARGANSTSGAPLASTRALSRAPALPCPSASRDGLPRFARRAHAQARVSQRA